MDFNQELEVTCLKTSTFVDYQKISCYFNFNEDRIELKLLINDDKHEKIEIQEPQLISNHCNYNKVDFPIITYSKFSKDDVSTLMINVNTKDILLNLFEKHQFNQFYLIVCFKNDKKSFTSFSISLPTIDTSNSKYIHTSILQEYIPELMKGGTDLKKLFDNNFKLYSDISQAENELLALLISYKSSTVADRFNNFNFLTMFQKMISIEDHECIKAFEKYSLENTKIIRFKESAKRLKNYLTTHIRDKIKDITKNLYIIHAKNNFWKNACTLSCGVYIYNQTDYDKFKNDHENLNKTRLIGNIKDIIGEFILVNIFTAKKHEKINFSRLYHVELVPNRTSNRMTQRALNNMIDMKMEPYLKTFETENILKSGSNEKFDKFEWFTTIKSNEEQQIAVKNIVNCSSFPSPFIIFGGPGTGKSTTIVEAIAQIVKLKPKSHVLFTAGSNTTCDDIANRLLKYISMNKILRIYSPSFEEKLDKVNNSIRFISNFRNSIESIDPSREEFLTARVIIVTLISVGRIVNAKYPAYHFDYIFIDEAGFVSEPESYIPLSGLGLSKEGVHAQVVLAGDHKQLRPVITNKFAQQMGLEISLMERLMDNDKKYQRSADGYDHKYVVQLKQNYRNHSAIMNFSNENFYNSQLIAMRTDRLKHSLITDEEFPIIFYNNTSYSEEIGTSLVNNGELAVLKAFTYKLLLKDSDSNQIEQSDIGIISPYSAQRDKITKMFSNLYPNIEIGTVDSFQGREKKIIILSCVRSGTSHVGFLNNQKRLNVALTRAQSLLVVIGNIRTLQKSDIWHKFIAYCRKNKAIVSDKEMVEISIKLLLEKLDKILAKFN